MGDNLPYDNAPDHHRSYHCRKSLHPQNMEPVQLRKKQRLHLLDRASVTSCKNWPGFTVRVHFTEQIVLSMGLTSVNTQVLTADSANLHSNRQEQCKRFSICVQ